MQLIGKEKRVDELLEVVLKDRHFYEKNGGGVTFSGGDRVLTRDEVIQIRKDRL